MDWKNFVIGRDEFLRNGEQNELLLLPLQEPDTAIAMPARMGKSVRIGRGVKIHARVLPAA